MGVRVSAMRRRGRQVLVWAVTIFLSFQLILGVLIGRYGLRVRFPQAAEVLGQLKARGQSPDIVTFGSSRFGSAINSALAENQLRQLTGDAAVSMCNVAVPAGDLTTTDWLLEELLKMGVRPRVAVIEISPEFLAAKDGWLTEHIRREVTWRNTPEYVWPVLRDGFVGPLLNQLCLPLCMHRYQICKETARLWQEGWRQWSRDYRLCGRLAATAAPRPPETGDSLDCAEVLERSGLDHGCRRLLTPQVAGRENWDPSQETGPAGLTLDKATMIGTDSMRRLLENYQIGGMGVPALERLLKRCHDNGILMVLVVPPFSKSQQVLYSDEINSRFFGHLEAVRGTYGFGLADYRGCLPDDCLIDNHHLSIAGREQFTAILVRELLAPLWAELRPHSHP